MLSDLMIPYLKWMIISVLDTLKFRVHDNLCSCMHYNFHSQVPVMSWFDDPNDTELLELILFFEALDKVNNVVTVATRTESAAISKLSQH